MMAYNIWKHNISEGLLNMLYSEQNTAFLKLHVSILKWRGGGEVLILIH
jgi:hypothetical protein